MISEFIPDPMIVSFMQIGIAMLIVGLGLIVYSTAIYKHDVLFAVSGILFLIFAIGFIVAGSMLHSMEYDHYIEQTEKLVSYMNCHALKENYHAIEDSTVKDIIDEKFIFECLAQEMEK